MKSLLPGATFLLLAILGSLYLHLRLHSVARPQPPAQSQARSAQPRQPRPAQPQSQLPPAIPPSPLQQIPIDLRLAEAIRVDNLEGVSVLLRAAPDMNAPDHEGNTALHLAASSRPKVVAAVLAAGPDVNRRNHLGQTALHIAVSNRVKASYPEWASAAEETIDLLLRADGIDPNIADRDGVTPLQIACEHPALDRPRSPHYHPPESKVRPHNPRLAERLLARGARDSLHLAILRRDAGAVASFLQAGADVNAADREGRTPLMAAAIVGDSVLMRDLVRRGAATGALTSRGLTPLMVAAEAGRTDSIQTLLELGADPNQAVPNQSSWPEHFYAEMTDAFAERMMSDPRTQPPVRAGLLLLQGSQLDWRGAARTEALFRQAAATAPRSTAGMNSMIRLSQMLAKQRRYKAAAEALEPLVAISPGAPPGQVPGPGTHDPRHDYCYNIATWYSQAGEPAKALPYARLARDQYKYSSWCGNGYLEHLAAVDGQVATLERLVAAAPAAGDGPSRSGP